MKNNSYAHETVSKIVFGVTAIVLFLPIIILPPYFQPSDWTRAMLFRIALTALTFFLLFTFFYKKNLSISLPKWNKSLYLPLLILGGFFVTVIISTIFSQDIGFSIFGSPARSGGAMNLLFLFLFSILLSIFINKSQWEKLFYVLFITGFLLSLLAITQYFNLLKNIFIAYEGGSTPSFLGNSTILAMYMIFLSFLSFTFFIQKQSKKQKLLYGVLFLLFVFTILISGSRAGYLGLLAGFLYFFLWYPYPKKYKTLKIIASTLLLLAVLTVAVFNFFPQLGKKNNILKTIATRVSISSIAKDVAGTRLSAWKMTLEAIKDKPLLGWGPENFYIGFEKHYDPTPFSHSVLLWDRPHNIFLDIAANSGLLSLLLYIAFWIALFWQLQRAKNSDYGTDRPLMAHGLQAMFIGYLIVLFFNFDSFVTHVISFFFIGYSFYLMYLQKERTILLPPQHTLYKKKTLVVACFLMAVLFLWFWNMKPLYLNEKIAHAKNLSKEGRCKEAFGISNKEPWEKAGIVKSHAILQYADIVKSCAFIEPEKEVAYSQKMVSLLKIATHAQPTFSRTWLFMASFTNVLAAREEAVDIKNNLLQEARDYLQKALELSPGRQEPFAELGKNYLIAQDYQAMKSMSNDCIAIDPRFGECYFYLGLAQIFLGEQEEGKKNIDLSIQSGYNYNPMYKQLAVAYMSQKNWTEAAIAYEKYNPRETSVAGTASYHATLAFLYEKVGNYQKAVAHALEVFRIQPENPETVLFIKLLLGKKPNDPTLRSSLAFIYMQPGPQQELSKAKAIYLQLASNEPQNTDYLLGLISIYYELTEYDRAYQTALSVMALDSTLKGRMEALIKTLPTFYQELYGQVK